jgi:hypothetical protein
MHQTSKIKGAIGSRVSDDQRPQTFISQGSSSRAQMAAMMPQNGTVPPSGASLDSHDASSD